MVYTGGVCGNIIGIACYDNKVFYSGYTDESIASMMQYYSCDTVLVLSVASAISTLTYKLPMYWHTTNMYDNVIEETLIQKLEYYTRKYNHISYGDMFVRWINSADHMPYNSCGNGSAIRAAYIGWVGNSLSEVEKLAEISARISHNHPEGVVGAKAVAGSIFLLRSGKSKIDVKNYVSRYYNMNFILSSVRTPLEFDATCPQTVPYAIAAFLENESYIDVVRAASSLYGDMDTIPCIAGSIAEALYDVPHNIISKARSVIGEELSLIADNLI